MTDDGTDGVFGAEFGLDSDEEEKTVRKEEKEKRTFQSEQDFLQQKRDWIPKVETREVIVPRDMLLIVEFIAFCSDYESTEEQV
jgi:hypothetical protein